MAKRFFNRLLLSISWLILCSPVLLGEGSSDKKPAPQRISILGLGDSITEGGETFQSYLFPLWQKLFTAGYSFDFIGPNVCQCRIGTLDNSGFGGKNAEFLESKIDTIYRQYPADLVLLHTGHNHFAEENPVEGIIRAQRSIIQKILGINPRAKILVAKVIPSGKLPKYSYIPELNGRIEMMVKELNLPVVVLVDQAKGFDWKRFTIGDKVHPNAAGAEKMASVWFQAIKKLYPAAAKAFDPELVIYKSLDSTDLKLHIFKPRGVKRGEARPAIIYFFGGGWSKGTPLQFYRECAYWASKGMVAVTAECRISYLHHSTPFDSFEDAREAIRWLRSNCSEWNIDPGRIAVAGASAGGQLAAAAGIVKEPLTGGGEVSSKPNLLLLYYPVIDNGPVGYGTEEMKRRYREISPLHNIDSTAPTSLFLVGTKDQLIPVKTAEEFKNRMDNIGVDCELHLFEGAGHPIFFYAKELTVEYYQVRELSEAFLQRFGYLTKLEKK